MDASEIQEHRKFFLATPLAVYMYVSSRVCLWVYLLSCLFLVYLQCLHSAHLPFLVLSAFFHCSTCISFTISICCSHALSVSFINRKWQKVSTDSINCQPVTWRSAVLSDVFFVYRLILPRHGRAPRPLRPWRLRAKSIEGGYRNCMRRNTTMRSFTWPIRYEKRKETTWSNCLSTRYDSGSLNAGERKKEKSMFSW